MSAPNRLRKLWPVNTTYDPNLDLDGDWHVGPCPQCVPYGGGPLCVVHAPDTGIANGDTPEIEPARFGRWRKGR